VSIFVTVLHVLVCLILIVVVLLQRGKGAEVGAVFGGGGGSTMFGSRGAGNFLTKLTSGAAIIFMFTSLVLAYFAQEDSRSVLFEGSEAVTEEPSPFQEAGQAPAESPAEASDEATSPFEEVGEVPAAEDAAPAADEATSGAAESAPGGAPENAGDPTP